MSAKDKKEIISEILESLFGKDDKISFYFMKKGKNTSKDEAIITFKTRKFHLLDGDTYYFAYYRRVWPMKECHKLRKEYMGLLKNHATVRIVIDHPNESTMSGKSRKEWPSPFNKAKKMISGRFIRLQASDKCKAYFSEDCDLPKNYWGGVIPEE